jgi:hypothetical protein
MKSNKTLIIILVIVGILSICILCTGVGVGGYLYFKDKVQEVEEDEDFDEEDKSDEDVDEEEDDDEIVSAQSGYITGEIGYPSEFIPDQRICAEDIYTGVTTCVDKTFTQNNFMENEYSIEVASGDYYVYAVLLETVGDYTTSYKAYYNEFVTCGLAVGCLSHLPIVVTVAEGETITDINPIDWYDFSQAE